MGNRKGEGYVSVCVMILLLCMLLSVFLTFTTAVGVVKQVKRNARVVLDSYVMERSIEIYDSVKNGKDEMLSLYDAEYLESLCEFCTFVRNEKRLYAYDSEGTELYGLTEPKLGYTDEGELKIYAEFSVFVPLRFSGRTVSTAEIPMKVTSRFTEKW